MLLERFKKTPIKIHRFEATIKKFERRQRFLKRLALKKRMQEIIVDAHAVEVRRGNTPIRTINAEYERIINEGQLLRKEKVCNARSDRRRSLFALKIAGKGKGGPKKKNLTADSEVRC